MDEYIKREDVLRAYEEEQRRPGPYRFETLIESVPAADVAPVRHGRWTDGDQYCPICRKDKFRGLDADVWADWKPDYCPNCGAKMDGGDDGETD